VIDWVGGLADLRDRVIRTIGDPGIRLREDPVRMLRAVALAARLDFTIDQDTAEAIRALRGEIVRSSPARLLDEFYKILRQGRARETFRMLHEYGLLAYLLPEADQAIAEGGERLLGSLARLDEYRNAGLAAPEQLTNALVMGSLLVPLGVPLRRVAAQAPVRRSEERIEDVRDEREPRDARDDEPADDVAAEIAALGATEEEEAPPASAAPGPLVLPFARRDLDRLRLVLLAQRRLREAEGGAAAKQALAGRHYFDEALRWLEIHGSEDGRELALHWRSLGPTVAVVSAPAAAQPAGEARPDGAPRPRRRRRRRRRRPGSAPDTTPQV
jgi:poly(A) polymerase